MRSADAIAAEHGVASTGGLMLWLTVLGGIGLWTIHVLAEISLVRYSETHEWAVWVMHSLTVALASLTLVLTIRAYQIAVAAKSSESRLSPSGRTAFLGWFGVAMNASNLVLIVVEGIFLATVRNYG
jgi:hypothetical protein